MRRCRVCQQVKYERAAPAGLLMPLEIPQLKWQSMACDFITGLPRTRRGNDSIWVCMDRLSKQSHFIPVCSTVSAKGLVPIFMREIFRLHGCPEEIVSDSDVKFTAEFWQTFLKSLGIKQSLTGAYHPQGNGQAEKHNGTLEDLLRPYCHAK